MWSVMGRGYKVNVMASPLLELNHGSCKIVVCARVPFSINADVVILTEYAPEVTVGKKNGS
jgi:hypothetical protein